MKNKLTKALKRISLQDVIPFVAFAVIFLFFTIASYSEKSGTFRMLTVFNLSSLVEQTMQTIIIASGTLFVVAMGSTDLSVGVNLALSGIVGTWAAYATGIDFLMIPVALLVGAILGAFTGVIVGKFKVSSFMVTLALLIGVRGLVNYLQSIIWLQNLPEGLSFLMQPTAKIIIFVIIIAIMAYIFEFTNIGRYSRIIGENETMALFVGIPVTKIKIIAFILSGLMAGAGGIFSVAIVGSTTQQMGVFQEMRTVMAIFLGGVLVTGGSSAKFYKILLGSFSIQIIVVGLALMGKGDTHISQTVQGLLLLLILVLCVWASKHRRTYGDSELEKIKSAERVS